jgi:glycosyltransferase involved in cell wall biosynthesis
MTSSGPTVSIGIPVFNGGKTLRQALDSLLAQTFTDFEVVISDNASGDETQKICEEYAAADPRIRYYRNERNLGARANFNRVFELSRGEFFRWNSHDDWVAPTFLERCLDALRGDPRAAACLTGMCRVREDGSVKGIWRADEWAGSKSQFKRYHDSLWRMPYYPIYGMFRTSALRQTDLLPNSPTPDRITLVQASLIGRFRHVDEMLFFQSPGPGGTRGRDVWTWLDPANVHAPKRAMLRVVRELWLSVDRFARGGRVRRVVMKADAVVFVAVGGALRGKWMQHTRKARSRIREARLRQLDAHGRLTVPVPARPRRSDAEG